jgi:glucose uptake protein GlcU
MAFESGALGLLCCLIAIFGFGTQNIFVKSKKILEAEIHPLLIALLYSMCIALVGAVIGLVVLSEGKSFLDHDKKSVFGPAIAACAFAPGNVLLLWACRRIGVGFAVGIVASTCSISSFVMGTVMCGDSIRVETQVPGILLMVLGIVLISATKIPLFEDFIDPIPKHLLVEVLGDSSKSLSQMPGYNQLQESLMEDDRQLSAEALALANQASSELQTSFDADRMSKDSSFTVSDGSDGDSLVIRKTDPGPTRINTFFRDDQKEEKDEQRVFHSNQGGGTLFLSPSGATILEHRLRRKKRRKQESMDRLPITRSVFVAAVLAAAEDLDLDMDWAALSMALAGGCCLGLQGVVFSEVIEMKILPDQLAVFMVSQFFVTSLLLLPSLCLGDILTSKTDSPALLSMRYAMCGAICFCAAVTGQVIGVIQLPVSVAMPLTQMNVVVAGLWSVLYFHELESPRLIATFTLAMCILIMGAVLLVL